MTGVTLAAPAKLTLSLRITGVRDDGYHMIDAEMVTLDLADRLTFSDGDGLELVGAAPDVTAGPDNLVVQALRAVGRTAHVRLDKRIPSGAGLGGGSADAACVLRWARAAPQSGQDWARVAPQSGEDRARATDLALAASLGADVPFCLVGGRARVRGVGEVVEPLPVDVLAGRAWTLLTPPFAVSTPAVYRAWDELGGPRADGPNDLEPAALVVAPRLAAWRDRLQEVTGVAPVLAGSGGTWFVEGAFTGEGLVVVRPGGVEG